jgi:hypothetical protein
LIHHLIGTSGTLVLLATIQLNQAAAHLADSSFYSSILSVSSRIVARQGVPGRLETARLAGRPIPKSCRACPVSVHLSVATER